jgi:hypothetical protein
VEQSKICRNSTFRLGGKLKENIGQLCPMKSVLNCSKPKYRFAKKFSKVETKNQWTEPSTTNTNITSGGSLNDYQSKAQQILFPFKIDSQSKNEKIVPSSPKKKNDEEWNPSEAFKKIHKDRKSESPNKKENPKIETKYYQSKPKEGEETKKYYQSKKEHHPSKHQHPSKETESVKESPKGEEKPKKEFKPKPKKSHPSPSDGTKKKTTPVKIYQPVKE